MAVSEPEELLPATRRALLRRVAVGQAEGRTPSIVGAVVRDGVQVWCGARSMIADHEPDGNIQYRIGSLTKMLVAVLIMRLREFLQRETSMYTSSMADPITFRPTAEDTENLAILTADGTSPTHAIRHALEIAAHSKRQEDLRADAARLAANPEYQAEIRAVREELDELRAW